jgi:hypothetical protein
MSRESNRLWKQRNVDRNRELNRRANQAYLDRNPERREKMREHRRKWPGTQTPEYKAQQSAYHKQWRKNTKRKRFYMNYMAIPGIKLDPTDRKIDKGIQVAIITDVVCDHFKLPFREIQARTRKREIVVPRQMLMWLIKKYTNWTWKAIGDHFQQDHSTVIHSFQVVNDLCDTDPSYLVLRQRLEQKIQRRNVNN